MPQTGGLSPLPRESCSPEARLAFFQLFFLLRSTSAATCNLRTSAAIHSRAPCTLPVTSWQLFAYLVPPWTAPTGRVSPSCQIPTTRAAMTSSYAFQKQTSHSEGFHTQAHMLCPPVNCAVRSANRTHCAGHVELSHTRPPGEPIHSESITSLPFVRRGIGNIYRVRFQTGFHSRKRARGGLVRCTV